MENNQHTSSDRGLRSAAKWLLFLMPCLGFICSLCSIGILKYQELDCSGSTWVGLGKPPEPVEELLSTWGFYVFVKSSSGKILECAEYKSTNPEGCWREINELPAAPYTFSDRELPCKPTGLRGRVAKSLDVARWEDDNTEILYRVVLLEDGTVWRWEHMVSHNHSWFYPVLVPLTTGAGLFAGIVLFFGLRVIARVQVRREKRRGRG